MNVLPPFLIKHFSRAPFVKYLNCKVLHLESRDVYKINQDSEEENQVAESTKRWLYIALKINHQPKKEYFQGFTRVTSFCLQAAIK